MKRVRLVVAQSAAGGRRRPGRPDQNSVLALVALAFVVTPALAQRVVLVSLDGLGNQILRQDPVAQELRVIQSALRRGASAEGMVPPFPSTTANSHAALWTGAYGDGNGIVSNNPPLLPRSEHTFRERGVGFRSDSLIAEPIWVAAARQGVSVVSHQATQVFPFTPKTTGVSAAARPPTIFNSYQTRSIVPAMMIRRKDVQAGAAPSGFSWKAGPLVLQGELSYDRAKRKGSIAIWVRPGGPRVVATLAKAEDAPPRGRPLARHFSAPLMVDAPESPVPGALHFRLFEVAPDGSDFLLYQSPLQEAGLHDGKAETQATVRAMLAATGGTIPNGPTQLLDRGGFGKYDPQSPADGGVAVRRYLEAVELQVRQTARQAAWLAAHYDPRLLISYIPYPDEIDHDFLALARQGNAQAQLARRWGYVTADRWCEEIVKLIGPGGHIVFTSDHGMAPVHTLVPVNSYLRKAGLGDKAAHVYNFILVNTTDWKGGVVPVEQRASVVDQVQRVLSGIKTPAGEPVFTQFFTPAKDGARFGIQCAACGDLYFETAAGYRAVDGREGQEGLLPVNPPGGAHGFLPEREDMLATLVVLGPRVKAGIRWPRRKSIDVAPLVTELLGVDAPKDSRGESPLRLR